MFDEQKKLVIPTTFNKGLFLEKLRADFTMLQSGRESAELTYFDTFDWLLYHKGFTFVRCRTVAYLENLVDETKQAQERVGKRKTPRFHWDCQNTDLSEKLRSLIDVRALLPLASLKRNVTSFRLLNRDQKTVADLTTEIRSVRHGKLYRPCQETLTVTPLRGYAREQDLVIKHAVECGATLTLPADSIVSYDLALKTAGRTVNDYSSKPEVDLDPTEPSEQALSELLLDLIRIIQLNERGIIEDIDTEFLHDFRVSIRKIRSLLKQIKDVYATEMTTECLKDFSVIGKSGNMVRDLDVYLHKKDFYLSLLPDYMQMDLERFFRMLTRRRAREHRKLCAFLSGHAYQSVIAKWQGFFSKRSCDNGHSTNTEVPIIKLVGRSIRKRHRKIIKQGRGITDDTPDAALHRLRIQCKKLRYQLESFRALYPEEHVTFLIRQLKLLQTNLGDFNDLSVHLRFLRDYLSKIGGTDRETIRHAAAIGALIGNLQYHRKEIRRQFHQAFETFASNETANIFKQLSNGRR